MTQAYTRPTAELITALSSDASRGLSDEHVAKARATYGINALSERKPPSFLRRLFETLTEPMMLILLLAAVIAIGVNLIHAFTGGEPDFFECVGILLAIGLCSGISLMMEGRSAKAFAALNRLNDDGAIKVWRNGTATIIRRAEVVVGDIVLLNTGDKLPADGRLISSTELCVNESSLTGESEAVEKDAAFLCTEETPLAERRNMVYGGCFVTSGHGRMIVTAIGDNSEFGAIARSLGDDTGQQTPLQERMAVLGKRITLAGITAATFIFFYQLYTFWQAGSITFATIAEAFISSIVLIVATVPEGLPTIVAVSLAVNIIKMARENALVKKMVACETIGCVSVICSDKTGTLTENRMTVVNPEALTSATLVGNCCLNTTAELKQEDGALVMIGNATECALLVAMQKNDVDYRSRRAESKTLVAFPFSSDTKCMTTVVATAEGCCVYTKGSPEKLAAFCSIPAEAFDEMAKYQARACRVIAFAHRVGPAELANEAREAIEACMTFDGFAAIQDPVRKEALAAVARCHEAGITVKMLTGDNLITAQAIATELGLLAASGIEAVEAGSLEALDDATLKDRLPSIAVIARSTPSIKMRVVRCLQELGATVAVTGDGINDAPALKRTDVGIAMGITGTEVSKEAADIVLLNDSFATIAKAVEWGRGIYENFQRMIQFQLTVNVSSVLIVLLSVILGNGAPFTALQLLWVNIIMDGPPALTLGLEPIRHNLMQRPPVLRSESILTRAMITRITINGLFIAAVFLALKHWNPLGATDAELSTVLFTIFVLFQLFNAFNCRSLSGHGSLSEFFGNPLMFVALGVAFVLQVVITQFGGSFFKTVPLAPIMWCKILLVSLSILIVGECVSWLVRRRHS